MTGSTRAIAAGQPRGPGRADTVEKEIAESCNRLIENTIICRDRVSARMTSARDCRARGRAKQAAWRDHGSFAPVTGHFNLLGVYNFSREKPRNNTCVPPRKSIPGIIPGEREPPSR